uniref:Uncharacterized protein n=1 Tax=Pipistrellus kuhlii TaxID=59472 RepID=A0A7J7ZL54_PIPKU|nr:hypothetical protein mPipKuh1_009659 [Pipistrellus kuhlii]
MLPSLHQRCASPVVGNLISPQSQISTAQQLTFLWRATFFKLKLLLRPLLQHRLAQAVVFCGRATLKGPKSRMWLLSRSLPTHGARPLTVHVVLSSKHPSWRLLKGCSTPSHPWELGPHVQLVGGCPTRHTRCH